MYNNLTLAFETAYFITIYIIKSEQVASWFNSCSVLFSSDAFLLMVLAVPQGPKGHSKQNFYYFKELKYQKISNREKKFQKNYYCKEEY